MKFNSEPVYGNNDKYMNTKIKIYDGNANTNFQQKKKKNDKRKSTMQVFINKNVFFR